MKKFSWDVFFIKITSRKFWIAVAGFITSVMTFLNYSDNAIVQVAAIIMAFGSVIGYLIANGLTDDTVITENKEGE